MKNDDDNEEAVNDVGDDGMSFPYPDLYQRLSLAVQRAYHDLRGLGYECYADLLCCQTCALSVIGGDSYVFWHGQDSEVADEDGVLHLSWDGDGDEIVEAMRGVGLIVDWDGEVRKRIVVELPGQTGKEAAA